MKFGTGMIRIALMISVLLLGAAGKTMNAQTSIASSQVFEVQPVKLLEWSPDGSTLAVLSRSELTIDLMNAENGQLIRTLGEGLEDLSQIETIAWSPDGSRLASYEVNQTARIWDAETGQVLVSVLADNPEFAYTASSLASIQWHPYKKLIAIGEGESLMIWDFEENELKSNPTEILETGVAWNPEGTRIAVIDKGSYILIFDTETFQEVLALKFSDLIRSSGPVLTTNHSQYLEWSPDGQELAHFFSNGDEKYIFISELATGEISTIVEPTRDDLQAIAWSPDGRQLAISTGSVYEERNLDNLIHIWSMETHEIEFSLEGHTDLVSTIAWSPDGQKLASGSWDGTIRIWDIPQALPQ
jgi:WD40 repeat protein